MFSCFFLALAVRQRKTTHVLLSRPIDTVCLARLIQVSLAARNRKSPRPMSSDAYANTRATIRRSSPGRSARVSRRRASARRISCRVSHRSIASFEAIVGSCSIRTARSPVRRQRSSFKSSMSRSLLRLEFDSDFDSRDESDNENENLSKSEVSPSSTLLRERHSAALVQSCVLVVVVVIIILAPFEQHSTSGRLPLRRVYKQVQIRSVDTDDAENDAHQSGPQHRA